jgi:hypothetical protein
MPQPHGGSAEPPSPSSPVVGVAVRDPNIREVILGLIRLNRMQVRGLRTKAPQVDVGPPDAADALLVGYIATDEDADYFEEALRQTGGLPSVALVPRDTNSRLTERVARTVTKVVSLPEGAQTIANTIRAQLESNTALARMPAVPARKGSSEVV